MNELFKNKTMYTNQIYKEYLEFHNKKYGKANLAYTIFILVLLIIFIGLTIAYSIYYLAVLTGMVTFAFIWVRIFYPRKQVIKDVSGINDKEYTFTFYNDYMTIEDGKDKEKFNYWNLYKLRQNNRFFYLYIDKTHAFLLQKDKFIVGEVNDFESFMKKKTMRRFLSFLKV